MAAEWDAIVVGSGPNGLVAANLLADAGWRVLLVEATGRTGGAVASAEVTAPGYLTDLFSAFYPLGAGSPVLAGLGLERYGLRWLHSPTVLAHVLDDGRAAVLDREPAVTAASVAEFAPGDGERWLSAYRDWCRVSGPLIDALFTPFPPVRAPLRLLRREGTADALRLVRRFMLSCRTLGEDLFQGEGARLLLGGCALHTDLGPDEAGSGVYGWLLAMLGQQVGFPVPRGGAGKLADALADRLRDRGATIRLNAPVTGVVLHDGHACGVVLADGSRVRARRAVLADLPAPVLYRDLVGLEHLPARIATDLDGFRYDHATLKVDYALGAKVPWRNPAAAGAGTVHLGADMKGLARYATDLANGVPPEEPFLLVGQMTTADPSRSPAGTESLWAYTHLPRRVTAEQVEAQVGRVERAMERHAPGFGALVRGRYVQGPAELRAGNPSLVGGAIGGGTSAISQQLVFRPVPGLGRADTPVDRLYLCSSSAHPGGGVHGAPGSNAARAALARGGWAGAAYRTVIDLAHRAIY